MARTLPWLQKGAGQGRSSPASSTSSRTKRQRLVLDSSDVERPSELKTRKGETQAIPAPESSMPSAAEPPEEEFMVDGFDNDDHYRMVEDEFLDIAKEFTQHLHAAEYQRLKNAARAQNETTISSISRPVSTMMPDHTRRKVESIARAKRQASAIQSLQRDRSRDSGDDSDEAQGPWLGTALQGLMEKPRAESSLLTNISGVMSSSKAAAGYKGSALGRMETYDILPFKKPDAMNRYFSRDSTCNDGETETEDEDEDDDLDAVPVDMPKMAPAQQNARVYSSMPRQVPHKASINPEERERPTVQQDLDTIGEVSADSLARIAKRREQARLKRLKDEADARNRKRGLHSDVIPTFL